MLTWFIENAATILITAALAVIVFFILRGMVRGRIKTCSDCASCGTCAAGESASGCAACPFHGGCCGEGEALK